MIARGFRGPHARTGGKRHLLDRLDNGRADAWLAGREVALLVRLGSKAKIVTDHLDWSASQNIFDRGRGQAVREGVLAKGEEHHRGDIAGP